MKNIIITGASGFIAAHIAAILKRDNKVFLTGISSTSRKLENFDEVKRLKLGQPIAAILKTRPYDLIIHCAFDKSDKKNTINTSGTLMWARESQQHKVKNQVFMSSISSQLQLLSYYGKSKLVLEEWFIRNKYPVLRLGLVVGNGGMFQRILNMVKKLPVLPLIGGGRSLIYLTDLEHITLQIKEIINPANQTDLLICNLHRQESITLKGLIREIKKILDTNCLLVPVPFFLVSAGIRVIKILRFIKLDFDEGNLKGLQMNQSLNIVSHIQQLGYYNKPLPELLNTYLDK